MPTVVVTQPSDGQTADANDINSQIDAILAVLNGNVDQDNLKDGGVTNAKLAGGITADKFASSAVSGWAPLGSTPNTVAYNGNRSYTLTFNSLDLTPLLSPGMRLQMTRTVAAPHQVTSLNGSSQYYQKTSPAGCTFTDTMTASGWVKLTSYATAGIISRYNGTSGFFFGLNSVGQVVLQGFNASSANYRIVTSVPSIPLNKWVHVAATFQMSDHTSSTCNAYIDGELVSSVIATAGTNPTALIQAGNLEVGSTNGGTDPFPGKLAQVALYSAVLSQATIFASSTQTLAGTETNLVSAYSFNNSIADLQTTNANNLTAEGSAVATAADSPFAQALTAGLLEYGIVMACSVSTNTTLVVQAPEGCAIPTSGGISSISYSPQSAPYLFPLSIEKWTLKVPLLAQETQASPTQNVWYNPGSYQIALPIGAWELGYAGWNLVTHAGTTFLSLYATLSTANNSESDSELTSAGVDLSVSLSQANTWMARKKALSVSVATPYFLNVRSGASSVTDLYTDGTVVPYILTAECAYL